MVITATTAAIALVPVTTVTMTSSRMSKCVSTAAALATTTRMTMFILTTQIHTRYVEMIGKSMVCEEAKNCSMLEFVNRNHPSNCFSYHLPKI
jgi:hypothetical protein